MTKRVTLNDLNRVGRSIEIPGLIEDDDGTIQETTVPVYLRKLNSHDREAALRKARAAKAAALIDAENEESAEYQAAFCEVSDLGTNPEVLIEHLVEHALSERAPLIEAEVGGAEGSEWAKDDYLQGLFDAWRGTDDDPGLDQAFQDEDHPDHGEAVKVFNELDRYRAEVDERLDVERDALRRDLDGLPLHELRRRLTKTYLEFKATAAFLAEYQLWRLYFGVRQNDKRDQRYFSSVQDVRDLDETIYNHLNAEFDRLTVEGLEGKGSRRPTSSSPRSPSQEQEETSASSGPKDVNT